MAGDQSRQEIFQLREFDLDLALFRLRALREDVEYELRAIDHFQIGCFRQGSYLRSLELSIEDEHVGAELQRANNQFIEFAAAKHCAWIDLAAALNDSILDHHSR